MATLRSGKTLDPAKTYAGAAGSSSQSQIDELKAEVAALKARIDELLKFPRPAAPPPVDDAPASTSFSAQLKRVERAAYMQPTVESRKLLIRVDDSKLWEKRPTGDNDVQPMLEKLYADYPWHLLSYKVMPPRDGAPLKYLVEGFDSDIQLVIGWAKKLRSEFGVTVMPYMTRFGLWLRQQRQAVYKQLLEDGCAPRWRGVEIRYTKDGRSQLYKFDSA